MRSEAVRTSEEIGFGGSYTEISAHSAGDFTLAEFLWELADIQDGFDWKLMQTGRIRAHLKGSVRRLFTPISAVAYSRTGRCIPEDRLAEAAQVIGLQVSDGLAVIAASNYAWEEPTCPQGELRRDILSVLMPSMAEMGPEPRRRIASLTH